MSVDEGKLHKNGLRWLHSIAMNPLFACKWTQWPVFVDELDQYGDGDVMYTKIDCDLDWFSIEYYSDFDCNQESKVNSLRFENGACYHGDVV